jgi:uncharacterized protein YecE (DUF72 family)
MDRPLYLGCPIWAYKGWIGSFYPAETKASDTLRQYSRRLTTVEGNTTFYATPAASTIQQWVEETPESFRFCPKLPRLISHTGKLVERIDLARQFIETMRQLGPRLGPMFLQLPPRYPPNLLDDLRAFLAAWPSEVELAVEVRHLGWFEPRHNLELNNLLSRHNMGRVVIDTRPIRNLQGDPILDGTVYQRMLAARQRKPNVPVFPERTASFVFVRYIGHPLMEQNIPYIEEWSHYLVDWLRQDLRAYVFCHCPQEEIDPWLCRQFHRQVSASTPLPPLPWDEADAGIVTQPRLF